MPIICDDCIAKKLGCIQTINKQSFSSQWIDAKKHLSEDHIVLTSQDRASWDDLKSTALRLTDDDDDDDDDCIKFFPLW